MRKGEKMSPEQRLKVSLSRKGKGLGNTNGFKVGQKIRKGSKHSDETRIKLSKALKGRVSPNKGKVLSEEQKSKISKSLFGRVASDELKEKNRIGQYNRYLKIDPNYTPELRNARIAKNGGFHSNGEWETLKAQYNWICLSCNRREPEIKLTRDHIIPLLKGGSNNIENIQPLCRVCNSKKHTNTIKY